MIVARLRVLLLGAALLASCARSENGSERDLDPRSDRPLLLLLTSLPIAFGDTFSIEATGSPLLSALEKRYRVRPIATASRDALQESRLLLMAQPLAQPAEDLVALDLWVRSGGRLLLLADPMLEWRDRRALGDATRPPAMFMDTGLLARWGLTLDAPGQRGERVSALAESPITVRSPGSLRGVCEISADSLVARCRIGKGRALVVADADFLDWSRDTGDSGQEALLVALDELERS